MKQIQNEELFSNNENNINMSALIKIDKSKEPFVVNARELHKALGSKQEFSNWIKGRIQKYDLAESLHFSFDKIIKPDIQGFEQIDYFLTIHTAKELAMVENNDRGRLARKYFIECEEKLKEVSKPLTLEEQCLNVISQLNIKIEEQNKLIEQDKPKVNIYDQFINSDGLYSIGNVAGILGLKKEGDNPDVGRNKLFCILRRDGYISGTKANQEYINQGLFRIKLTPIKGEEALYPQTFMTPKGLEYFIKKYKGGELCLKETKSKKSAK